MYVAPRYHTNQVPIMNGWKEQGDVVCFISQYAGKLEDYSCITPFIAGYSHLFCMVEKFARLFIRNEGKRGEFRFKCGIPPLGKLRDKMREFQPDLVILRERSIYSICCYLMCRQYGYPAVLYNQSPLWEKEIKKDWAHRMVRKLTPSVRMTPVLGNPQINHEKEDHAYYIPFVMQAKLCWKTKVYFAGKRINIFSVGKYEERKNHRMMIETVGKLSGKYSVFLRIAGECTTKEQEGYYQGLKRYIKENGLGDKVWLFKNLNREQVEGLYAESDVFVIPSTREPASVSQLEAMAFSLPVICSDTNGTACYVENGRNGFQFRDNDKEDLKDKVEALIRDKERLRAMGKESYMDIVEKYSFRQYRVKMEEIRKEIVGRT